MSRASNDAAAREAFVRAQTRLTRLSDLGGLALWLTDDLTALWVHLQTWLRNPQAALPYWAHAWPGGLALARFVREGGADVAGRRVFDFATGSGVVALAAASAGAARVVACDIDALALCAVGLNAAANGLEVERQRADPLGGRLRGYDVLLAGDVCYEAEPSPHITRWLRDQAAGGVRVLVGEPHRLYRPKDGFRVVGEYDVPTRTDVEGCEQKCVSILQMISTSS